MPMTTMLIGRNSKSRGKVNLLKEYKARTRSVIRLNESTRIITAEILNQFSSVQKGVIQLPWNHSVPQGKYAISLRISNEGYSVVLDSMIMVIIK